MGAFQNLLGREVLSPPCRLQFPNIAEPDVGGQFSDGKYKAFFLFDKKETEFKEMKAVAEELCQLAFKCPLKEIEHLPFKDGDEKNWQGFANTIYIIAKSKNPVDVWSPTPDATGQLYKMDPKKLYAGCICRAVLVPYAYMSGTNRGITFLLNFIQFLEDASRFGGLGQVDARDILTPYAGKAQKPVSAPVKAEAEEEESSASSEEEAPQTPAAAAKRGRPSKAASTEEAESPSAKAKREAAERRASENGAAKGPVADLPVAKKPEVSKSSASLMDMM